MDVTETGSMKWAQRLARVFDIDITICPDCGDSVRIIASIEEPRVIKKILNHLGVPDKPPKLWPARAPPSRKEVHLNQLQLPDNFNQRPSDWSAN